MEEASGASWPGVLDEPAPPLAATAFTGMVHRRLMGEPVQYVVGHWAFRHLDLLVNPSVLIPRPETEVVVEVALAELDGLPGPRPRAVDLGTGSGAIALSLAYERADVEVWAVDRSPAALSVASANLAGLGTLAVGRAHMALGDWWQALPPELAGRVDLMVSNPPYVAEAELATLPREVVCWEPRAALAGGPDGLGPLAAIMDGAPHWMAPRSTAVVEIAPDQAVAALEICWEAGFSDADVRNDLAGRPRVLVAHRRGPAGRR